VALKVEKQLVLQMANGYDAVELVNEVE